MYNILFVCTGNICRSPIAEFLFKDLIIKNDLSHKLNAKSAGLGAWNGLPAADFTLLVGKENGLDLESHRSQSINFNLIHESDLILGMAYQHKNEMQRMFPQYLSKIETIREFNISNVSSIDIDDPYGRNYKIYKRIFKETFIRR